MGIALGAWKTLSSSVAGRKNAKAAEVRCTGYSLLTESGFHILLTRDAAYTHLPNYHSGYGAVAGMPFGVPACPCRLGPCADRGKEAHCLISNGLLLGS